MVRAPVSIRYSATEDRGQIGAGAQAKMLAPRIALSRMLHHRGQVLSQRAHLDYTRKEMQTGTTEQKYLPIEFKKVMTLTLRKCPTL